LEKLLKRTRKGGGGEILTKRKESKLGGNSRGHTANKRKKRSIIKCDEIRTTGEGKYTEAGMERRCTFRSGNNFKRTKKPPSRGWG